MPEYDYNYMPWTISNFFFFLSIIVLIVAILVAIWYFVTRDPDHDRWNLPMWLFLMSIALGIVALVQQGNEQHLSTDVITRTMKKL